MKKTKFSETQIVSALKAYEAGKSILDLSREMGVSKATFYYWLKKYQGMESSDLKRMKELEEENRRLKKMYAELAMDNMVLKDVLSKKF
jgi:putative transposase